MKRNIIGLILFILSFSGCVYGKADIEFKNMEKGTITVNIEVPPILDENLLKEQMNLFKESVKSNINKDIDISLTKTKPNITREALEKKVGSIKEKEELDEGQVYLFKYTFNFDSKEEFLKLIEMTSSFFDLDKSGMLNDEKVYDITEKKGIIKVSLGNTGFLSYNIKVNGKILEYPEYATFEKGVLTFPRDTDVVFSYKQGMSRLVVVTTIVGLLAICAASGIYYIKKKTKKGA